MLITSKLDFRFIPAELQPELCPYRDAPMNICTASLTAMRVTPSQRLCYCSTENFSDCAIFLSKTLRSK
jgi:hypothetical protein